MLKMTFNKDGEPNNQIFNEKTDNKEFLVAYQYHTRKRIALFVFFHSVIR